MLYIIELNSVLLNFEQLDRDELNSLLKTLRYREEDFERSIVWKRGELHPLQVARDKLCSVNKAYEVGTICSGGELNTLVRLNLDNECS